MRRIIVIGLLLALGYAGSSPAQTPPIQAVKVVDGLVAPVFLTGAGDNSGRTFVLDQVGKIYIMQNGQLVKQPFLDISDRLVELNPGYDERGLLGLAFHPQYQKNGRLFVFYSVALRDGAPEGWDHTNVISEFHVSDLDANQVDPNSERIILQVDHPQSNHNGGTLAFGADGYLYISEGDGGGANDTDMGHTEAIGNGQDLANLLGSVLRIDVNGTLPYEIPADNPFVGVFGADEIYAYGLRNPYRFSFDRGGDHRLFLGDAGQNLYEEVDIINAGDNYGWNLHDGTHCFDPNDPMNAPPTCRETGYFDEPLIDPIIEFANSDNPHEPGLAVTVIGGYVYRGQKMSALAGDYIFGGFSREEDETDGSIFRGYETQQGWEMEELKVQESGSLRSRGGRFGHFVRSFGEDDRGELYVLSSDSLGPAGTTGKVFALTMGPQTGRPNRSTSGVLAAVAPGKIVVGSSPDGATLHLSLSKQASTDLSVFDISGRQVRTLLNGVIDAGEHEVLWDGRSDNGSRVPSGVYFARMKSSDGTVSERIVLAR